MKILGHNSCSWTLLHEKLLRETSRVIRASQMILEGCFFLAVLWNGTMRFLGTKCWKT